MPAPNFIAGGTINPATFVKVSTAADNTVLAAGAGEWTIGIATPSQKLAPIPSNSSTYAATTGDAVTVFGLGDICNLQAGTAGWTRGAKLASDASGNGVAATTGDYVGAVALESASASSLGRVQVLNFKI